MRNPIAAVVRNESPVPLAPRRFAQGFMQGMGVRRGYTEALNAMETVGTVFAIVNANAESVADVEWHLYSKAASGNDGDRKEITSHAALDLLNTPNPFYTRFDAIETFQQHLDLVGEGAFVVAKMGKLPVELWPVRPDRIEPVPHPTKFISGYVYTSPDGEQIPLEVDEVLRCKLPNPGDPYRGLGPIQSVLTKLDVLRYSAEWNRNFFINGAQPGGIIKVDRRLSDREFNEMRSRWDEQHRGVARAHRVQILEQGDYEQLKFSARDMQFAELGAATREDIREAFRFPKPMLGTVEDVNRANAEAAEVMYGRWTVRPRLRRIQGMLNFRLLKMYGVSAKGLEFDFDNPVPDDKAGEDIRLATRVTAAVALIGTGKFEPASVLSELDLPEIEEKAEPDPPPEPIAPPGPPVPPGTDPEDDPDVEDPDAVPAPEDPTGPPENRHHHHHAGPRAVADPDAPSVDLSDVQVVWDKAMAKLLKKWENVWDAQNTALLDQIAKAVDRQDPLALADIMAPEGMGATYLEEAMLAIYGKSADAVVEEAAAASVVIEAAVVSEDAISVWASSVSKLMAKELAISAARKAIQLNTDAATGDEVALAVKAHLESLTHASAQTNLGGALTGAQNRGRIDTFRSAPVGAYYGDEQLDSNTCKECRQVNGKWLGNTADEAEFLYPNGGYRHCEGGARCRGTVVVTWRGDDPALWQEKEGVDITKEFQQEQSQRKGNQ